MCGSVKSLRGIKSDIVKLSQFDKSGKGVINVDDVLIFGIDQVQVGLKKEFLSSCTTMDTNEKLKPNNGKVVSQLEYSRVIGCLLYAMTCTRPDIAFVVGKLSRYPSVLEGYTHISSISNVEDNSSTSGWVLFLGGGAILWASKKQTCITSSTMKYEFVALAATGNEVECATTLAKAYSQIYNRKSRQLRVRHNTNPDVDVHRGVIRRLNPSRSHLIIECYSSDINKVWRESSHDFRNEGGKIDFVTPGTPSPQRSPALSSPNNYGILTPKEVKIFFQDEVIDRPVRRRSIGVGSSRSEVLIRSGQLSNSGVLRKGGSEIDEEDPFLDDDLPDEYRQLRYSKCTLLQLFSLILISAALVCTLNIPYFKHKKLFDLKLWKWAIMYVIETLSGPPLIEIQQEQEEEDRMIEEVQRFQNAGATLPTDLKENLFKKNGRLTGTPRANTPMAGNGKSGKFLETTTPKKVDEGITIDHLHRLNQKNISAWNMKRLMHIVRKGTLSTLDRQLEGSRGDEEDESAVQITNEMQAKVAAKKIFINVAKQGSKSIYLADLMHFLREDEAWKAIQLFDVESETQGISKRALKNWVVNVFRERKALALSLDDTKTAVKKLHLMLNIALVVEEMNILTTVFLRFDKQKIIYPNSVLATKPIANYYRSPDMRDDISFSIHVSTPVEKVSLMKQRITSYVENKNEHWHPAPSILVRDVEDLNRVNISIWLFHRMNFQNMLERWKRRGLLLEEMIKIFKDLDIEYRMLPVDINVRKMPTLDSNRLPSNWNACTN
ncbi:mechanosensitive ion channel protein 6-like protein [Tanacetum coccineum]